jgi:hypothetical protein
MYALGRAVNAVTSATTAKVKAGLQNCGGVTIFAIGATSGDVTLFSYDAAGNETAFTAVYEYFTQASGVWTSHTNAGAAVSAITCATGGLLCVEIDAQSLPDNAVTVAASHSAGSFVIVKRDLHVQRKPANLADARAF